MVGQRDTQAWVLQTWAAFLLALLVSCIGIYYLPTESWVKGYAVMGFFFTVGSTFSLAKTVRDNRVRQVDTGAWIFQVWTAFVVSVLFTSIGIYHMQVDPWVKGYAGIALAFAISSSFTLAKTVRDNHERAMHELHQQAELPTQSDINAGA